MKWLAFGNFCEGERKYEAEPCPTRLSLIHSSSGVKCLAGLTAASSTAPRKTGLVEFKVRNYRANSFIFLHCPMLSRGPLRPLVLAGNRHLVPSTDSGIFGNKMIQGSYLLTV